MMKREILMDLATQGLVGKRWIEFPEGSFWGSGEIVWVSLSPRVELFRHDSECWAGEIPGIKVIFLDGKRLWTRED